MFWRTITGITLEVGVKTLRQNKQTNLMPREMISISPKTNSSDTKIHWIKLILTTNWDETILTLKQQPWANSETTPWTEDPFSKQKESKIIKKRITFQWEVSPTLRWLQHGLIFQRGTKLRNDQFQQLYKKWWDQVKIYKWPMTS